MYFVIMAGVILLDQVTKFFIYSNMDLHQSIPIITDFFHITYTRNFGAAFSLLQNQQNFFITMTSIVTIIIFYVMIRYKRKLNKVVLLGLSFIAGGAIGNLIDRIRWGYVTDFLDFRIWPIFNVADMSIVFGTALLVYFIFVIDPKIQRKSQKG